MRLPIKALFFLCGAVILLGTGTYAWLSAYPRSTIVILPNGQSMPIFPAPQPPQTMPDPYSQPGMIAVVYSGVLVKHAAGGVLVKGVWSSDDQGIFIAIPDADDFHQMKNPEGALTPYYKAGDTIYMFTGTSTKRSANDLPLPTPVSISGADTATFVPGLLPQLLFIAKDKNHVYISGVPDSTIDAKTLAVVPNREYLFRDAFHVYKYTGGPANYEITPFDPQTITFFSEYDNLDSALDNEYIKDKNGVYFGEEKIAGADPATFTVFTSPKLLALRDSGIVYSYAKDKGRVYFKGVVMPSADPDTFAPVVNDSGGRYTYFYGKDASVVYEGTTTIPGLDPNSFKVLWTPTYEGCGSAMYIKDATHVFYKQAPLSGADAGTFESLIGDYGRDKNGMWEGTKFRSDLPKDFQPVCNYG